MKWSRTLHFEPKHLVLPSWAEQKRETKVCVSFFSSFKVFVFVGLLLKTKFPHTTPLWHISITLGHRDEKIWGCGFIYVSAASTPGDKLVLEASNRSVWMHRPTPPPPPHPNRNIQHVHHISSPPRPDQPSCWHQRLWCLHSWHPWNPKIRQKSLIKATDLTEMKMCVGSRRKMKDFNQGLIAFD